MGGFSRAALVLVIIGAVNWLLVGLFQWDLVTAIFGGDIVRESSGISRIVYVLVGLAGIYAIRFLFDSSTERAQ
ncbi:DUF378 domain-containing protein [Mechercharimyces sp. CAU 1602]|uniref:DUF378 domain-containing protein n=1 Tax=Mechercharimyces sp. CAU 1602 TaxID=2973933 RepID=UPI002163A1C7|nr:DUF378 domain-containing protein [Mechercharimyces sp. CAU 1602]MCS1350554.1 DUF378 domain-containing protein [Mechercharimyces sp. CAU 1602]